MVSLVLTSTCKFIQAQGFQFPRKTILRFRTPQRSWQTIRNNFLARRKFKGTHLLNIFNFWTSNFFLGPGSHKPVMFNALWKWFKMTNNRNKIGANQRWVLYITWVITKNCSTSQDCVGKIVNFCKLILKAENVTGKLFFSSVFLSTRVTTQYRKQSSLWNPRACSFEDFCYSVWSQCPKTILSKSGHKFPSSYKYSHM